MKTIKLLVLAAVLAASPACKKDKAKPEQTPAGSAAPAANPDPAANAATATAPSGGGTEATAPAADTADWIKVYASHTEKKETDPVEVSFESFKVVKASVDPKKIEGSTATLEIDLSSLKTGDGKRDEHVASPDYLDVKKFATATVEVGNVAKKDDRHYTADAAVKFRGVEKKYPLEFEVVEAKDDWIRIKTELMFKRLDFNVGKKAGDMSKGEDGVADDLTLKAQLTLKST